MCAGRWRLSRIPPTHQEASVHQPTLALPSRPFDAPQSTTVACHQSKIGTHHSRRGADGRHSGIGVRGRPTSVPKRIGFGELLTGPLPPPPVGRRRRPIRRWRPTGGRTPTHWRGWPVRWWRPALCGPSVATEPDPPNNNAGQARDEHGDSLRLLAAAAFDVQPDGVTGSRIGRRKIPELG